MQKIDGTTIHLTRGDVLKFDLSINYEDGSTYTFQPNDKVVFSVYEKKKLSGNALLKKEISVETSTDSLRVSLTNEDTKMGQLIDKPIELWYEIELNNEYTVVGYDEDGAKILMLYPEGSKL